MNLNTDSRTKESSDRRIEMQGESLAKIGPVATGRTKTRKRSISASISLRRSSQVFEPGRRNA